MKNSAKFATRIYFKDLYSINFYKLRLQYSNNYDIYYTDYNYNLYVCNLDNFILKLKEKFPDLEKMLTSKDKESKKLGTMLASKKLIKIKYENNIKSR